MGIKLGNTTIGSLYLGSTKIGAAYLGSTKVYESVVPTSEELYAPVVPGSGTNYLYTFGALTSSLGNILANKAVTVTLKKDFAPGQSGRSYYLAIYPKTQSASTMPSYYLIYGNSATSFPSIMNNIPAGTSLVYDVSNINSPLSNLSLATVLANPTAYAFGALVYSSSSSSFKGVCQVGTTSVGYENSATASW